VVEPAGGHLQIDRQIFLSGKVFHWMGQIVVCRTEEIEDKRWIDEYFLLMKELRVLMAVLQMFMTGVYLFMDTLHMFMDTPHLFMKNYFLF